MNVECTICGRQYDVKESPYHKWTGWAMDYGRYISREFVCQCPICGAGDMYYFHQLKENKPEQNNQDERVVSF